MTKVGDLFDFKGPDWVYENLSHPVFWKDKSKELKNSSEILYLEILKVSNNLKEYARSLNSYYPVSLCEDKSSMSVYLFLTGLSIENIIKGIILLKEPDLIGKKIKYPISTHDLNILFEYGQIDNLSEDEKKYNEIASRAIVSFGRYPIPKDVSSLDGGYKLKLSIKEVFDGLHLKLENEFDRLFLNNP